MRKPPRRRCVAGGAGSWKGRWPQPSPLRWMAELGSLGAGGEGSGGRKDICLIVNGAAWCGCLNLTWIFLSEDLSHFHFSLFLLKESTYTRRILALPCGGIARWAYALQGCGLLQPPALRVHLLHICRTKSNQPGSHPIFGA